MVMCDARGIEDGFPIHCIIASKKHTGPHRWSHENGSTAYVNGSFAKPRPVSKVLYAERCYGTGLTVIAGSGLRPICKICKQEVRVGNRNRALSHSVPL
jgi:hypothetical protein